MRQRLKRSGPLSLAHRRDRPGDGQDVFLIGQHPTGLGVTWTNTCSANFLSREFPLFGCAARVCAEQIDLSRNHVRVQSILALHVFFREAGEEASLLRAVSRSFHLSDIHG
jgi:hypothetical protein